MSEAKASECRSPGFCTCPGMTRCEWCGYTEHDKAWLMDHRYCAGSLREPRTDSATNEGRVK